jgi:hypothetical protein
VRSLDAPNRAIGVIGVIGWVTDKFAALGLPVPAIFYATANTTLDPAHRRHRTLGCGLTAD